MTIKRQIAQPGFSLVEVVVAVGIFALAIVGVIGLLGPTTRSVVDVSDSDAATRVVSTIQSALQQRVASSSTGFTTLGSVLQVGATPSYDFYATKDGRLVGRATDFSAAGLTDSDKFFEFALLRNTSLSGADATGDASAGYLAFTISLRWPAYVSSSSGAATAVSASQKSVMIVPAAVTR
ncbi:MAG: prepilin-type N-terminal cleavage/methylation domain-containing protein [Rariglobus sp.]|nr:type II secretion system protein [Rariglobus sp.]